MFSNKVHLKIKQDYEDHKHDHALVKVESQMTGSSNATRVYDVYCFVKIPVLVITMIPASMLGRKMSCITSILMARNSFVNIVDPSSVVDEDQLIEFWAVAKACLSPKPSKQPEMPRILEALEDPKSVKFSTYANTWLEGILSIAGKTSN